MSIAMRFEDIPVRVPLAAHGFMAGGTDERDGDDGKGQ
jgi:hypothetical protein